MEHEEKYEKMNMAEKSWTEVSFGYFVPLSNKEMTPHELLDDYFGRAEIESVIKTGKAYVNLLPLCNGMPRPSAGRYCSTSLTLSFTCC